MIFEYTCKCGRVHSIEIGEIQVQEIKHETFKKAEPKEETKGSVRRKGIITASTDKALLLMIGGQEGWVPRSTISSEYDESYGNEQEFLIQKWINRVSKKYEEDDT